MDDWLEAHKLPLALAVLAVAAVAAVLALQHGGDSRPLVLAVPTAPAARAELMVYVSGEVIQPGVYPLREGDRVEQAIAAAGGPTADADLEAINLALRLKDEQQVRVPRRVDGVAAAGTPAAGLLNLNTATLAELDALPGVGEVTAQRIVDYRTRNGPFHQIEELKSAKLVNAATYEKIRGLITVQ